MEGSITQIIIIANRRPPKIKIFKTPTILINPSQKSKKTFARNKTQKSNIILIKLMRAPENPFYNHPLQLLIKVNQ